MNAWDTFIDVLLISSTYFSREIVNIRTAQMGLISSVSKTPVLAPMSRNFSTVRLCHFYKAQEFSAQDILPLTQTPHLFRVSNPQKTRQHSLKKPTTRMVDIVGQFEWSG